MAGRGDLWQIAIATVARRGRMSVHQLVDILIHDYHARLAEARRTVVEWRARERANWWTDNS
jgi:hypothetical protein